MKVEEKNRAIALRREGRSMNEIVSLLGVSKASVSLWVRDVDLTEEQKNKLSLNNRSVASIEKRRINRLRNQKNKDNSIKELAMREIKSLSLSDLRLIGSALYLGEGVKAKKGGASVANSDPVVIKIMVRFFNEVCNVPFEKFRGSIHTFDNADIESTEKYWSAVTGIPRIQFHKTYAKQSKSSLHKRKTLPYGTFNLSVYDTKVFLKIMGWIDKIKALAIAP